MTSRETPEIQAIQDVLILSNGPGELTTWVRPVVAALRDRYPDPQRVRISIVLAPCPNGTGREAEVARALPGVDRVQGSRHFWKFLLWGKTAQPWPWSQRGVMVFLGGDQFFALLIAKRLGFRSVLYAEWEARWWGWGDHYALRNDRVLAKMPPRWRSKARVVGDLMTEVVAQGDPDGDLVGLMPGSKGMKLAQGVPLELAIAQHLAQLRPQTRFQLFLAPTVDLRTLAKYGDPAQNPLVGVFQCAARLQEEENGAFSLVTDRGLRVPIVQEFPADRSLAQCALCLTTVGANTAQLAALHVPMVVILPTQQIDAMRSWDGIPGILANLPGVGTLFAQMINRLVIPHLMRSGKLFAWPNIWAGRAVVPELFGRLDPPEVARQMRDYLDRPEALSAIRQDLAQVAGKPGAAKAIGDLVAACLSFQEKGKQEKAPLPDS